jgi:hypothetical protein
MLAMVTQRLDLASLIAATSADNSS